MLLWPPETFCSIHLGASAQPPEVEPITVERPPQL
jgi:hypothetical protein